MRLIYLIPFILFGISQAYAETGYDYFNVVNPNGTNTWSSHYPYIQHQNGNWVPFLSDGNKIETNFGSIILNADGTYSFYKKGIVDSSELFTDSIRAKYADVSNLNSWTYPNSLNNDTPTVSWSGNNFVMTKESVGVGKLEYKYILNNGSWKTQLEATNLSTLTTKVFGFDQTINLNRDTINFGGQQRNLDNFNGTTFDKTWLDNNHGSVINFLNSVNFDFDLGFENLYSVTVYDTGINSSRLVFDYRTSTPLLPNETLIIDPTFGYAGASGITNVYQTTCSGAYATNTPPTIGLTATHCFNLIMWWDVTTIPDSADVSNVNVRYDVLAKSPTGISCDWWSVEGNGSTMTDAEKHTDAQDGTKFVSASTQCNSVANDKVIDLGSSADADLESELGVDNEWGIGLAPSAYVSGDTIDTGATAGTYELEVTYTVPIPQTVTAHVFESDSSTALPGNIKVTNSTTSQTYPLNSTGFAVMTGLKTSTNQNFTIYDSNSYIVNRTINFVPVANETKSFDTNIFRVSCGSGNDVKIITNETNAHYISSHSIPKCSTDTVSWNSTFTSLGNYRAVAQNFTSKLFATILDLTSFNTSPSSFKINGTSIGKSFSSPNMTSSSFNIANGINSVFLRFSLVLESISSNLSATPFSSSRIDLSWTAPVVGTPTGYKIFQSIDNSTWTVHQNNTGTTTTSKSVTLLSSSTLYYFMVAHWESSGISANSTVVSATTLSSSSGSGISGGGGSGSNPVTSIENALLLNLGSKTISHSLGEKRTYSLELLWDKAKEFSLTINNIKIGQGSFDSLSILPELLPSTGKKIVDGKGEIFLTVDAPGDKCDQIQVTARCVYVKTYTIPVTVSVTDILGTSYPDIPAVLTISIVEKFPIGLAVVVILLLAVSYPIARIISQNSGKSSRKSPEQMQKDHQKALKKSEKMERKQAEHDMNLFKKIKKEF